MKQADHIGVVEAIFLLWVILDTNIFLGLPRYFAASGESAMYLLPLFCYLFLSPILWMIIRLRAYHPQLIFTEIPGKLWGQWASTLLAWFVAIFFAFSTGNYLRQFVSLINDAILPLSPASYLIIPFVFAIAFGAYHGAESISRANYLLLPITLGGYLLLLGSAYIIGEPSFATPFFGPGLDRLFWGGLYRVPYFLEIVILTVLFPHFRSNKQFRQVIWYGTFLNVLLLALGLLAYALNFPPTNTQNVGFPLFQLSRNIYFGRYLQRVEALFTFIWVIMSIFKMSLSLYAGSIAFARGIGAPFYQPYVPPMAVLTVVFCFLAPNYLTALEWEWGILRYASTVPFVAFLSLLLVASYWQAQKKSAAPRGRTPSTP
ncbi:GerAB/ArcD/ProY family transporter [Heliobacterium gestii]|uniref:GerAB/ArcD/ProY family transporter n=1 Tax=Heliomicrobium gestii TaxID=2699 RepID=A0A845LB05_HELGE|nr:GerAB/ArcD/ProY family transporter [Heliomicrobium gestii]MBM7867495.1 spore germination protein KB [Heliomicrobium gestii]MZP43957.1 GerAB/ArcD/ProY family transporter [Heliomicrobium gestii]